MVDTDRRLVKDTLVRYGEREQDLKEFIAQLYELVEKHDHSPYRRLLINIDHESAVFSDSSCLFDVSVLGERLENDVEFSKRIDLEAAQKSNAENRERREYERLKKLFGE